MQISEALVPYVNPFSLIFCPVRLLPSVWLYFLVSWFGMCTLSKSEGKFDAL